MYINRFRVFELLQVRPLYDCIRLIIYPLYGILKNYIFLHFVAMCWLWWINGVLDELAVMFTLRIWLHSENPVHGSYQAIFRQDIHVKLVSVIEGLIFTNIYILLMQTCNSSYVLLIGTIEYRYSLVATISLPYYRSLCKITIWYTGLIHQEYGLMHLKYDILYSYHSLPMWYHTNILFISAVVPDRQCCQASSENVILAENRGLISNYMTESSGCGGTECPWILKASHGQRFNISLYDFGTHLRVSGLL